MHKEKYGKNTQHVSNGHFCPDSNKIFPILIKNPNLDHVKVKIWNLEDCGLIFGIIMAYKPANKKPKNSIEKINSEKWEPHIFGILGA